jgi:hypothetical protein
MILAAGCGGAEVLAGHAARGATTSATPTRHQAQLEILQRPQIMLMPCRTNRQESGPRTPARAISAAASNNNSVKSSEPPPPELGAGVAVTETDLASEPPGPVQVRLSISVPLIASDIIPLVG